MKKLFALLLTIAFVISSAACADGGSAATNDISVTDESRETSDTTTAEITTTAEVSTTTVPTTEADTTAATENRPLPVLQVGGEYIACFDKAGSLKEKFSEIENSSFYGYTAKTNDGQEITVWLYENRVWGWRTFSQGTGIVDGINIGDSYEEVLKAYPQAFTKKQLSAYASGKPMEPYDPEKDISTTYVVFMDKKGKAYSMFDYKKHVGYDLSKWFELEIKVKNAVVTDIKFYNLKDYVVM